MKPSIKQITYTAVLLALCIGVQQLKMLSHYITGSMVNAILILAVLRVGLWSGLVIAVLSPVLAFLIVPMPVLQAVPQMLPLIALANAVIVLCVRLFGQKRLPVGLAAGAALKPLTLFLGVRYIILPYFEATQPDAMINVLKVMFSTNQLITAALGSLLAYAVYRALPKTLHLWEEP
jgi:hypothetical protein